MQALAQKYGRQIRFIEADVNSTAGVDLANEYQVTSIPALFFIDKGGNIVNSYVGALSEEDLESYLKNLIQK